MRWVGPNTSGRGKVAGMPIFGRRADTRGAWIFT